MIATPEKFSSVCINGTSKIRVTEGNFKKRGIIKTSILLWWDQSTSEGMAYFLATNSPLVDLWAFYYPSNMRPESQFQLDANG